MNFKTRAAMRMPWHGCCGLLQNPCDAARRARLCGSSRMTIGAEDTEDMIFLQLKKSISAKTIW
jgi:hypothetical protein